MLNDDEIPILSPHVGVQDTLANVVVFAPGVELSYPNQSAFPVRSLLPRINGTLTVAELSAAVGLTAREFRALFVDLAAEGYINDAGPIVREGDIASRLSAYFSLCDLWAGEIFLRPFWRIFLRGNASKDQVIGWGTQFYHRTVGADEHNAMAVAHCKDPEMKLRLSQHFEEEVGHGEMFLAGLAACGLARDEVASSDPLPTTRRLIEYMNELAKYDSWAYLGCYGVLHSPRQGQTPEAMRQQFDTYARLYPHSKPIFEKICQHALLDLELEHEKIVLEEYLNARGHFSTREARSVLSGARGMVQVFSSFFDGILEHY